MLSDWIYDAQSSGIVDYDTCNNTLINWQNGILNTFDYTYTNGFTEGCNNRIKVLKRNAYGSVILNDLEKEFYIYFHIKNKKFQTFKKR